MPSILVERGDGQCRERRLIGEKDQRLCGLRVLESDTSQVIGIMLLAVETLESNGLVEQDAGRSIGGSGIHATRIQIGFGASDEKCPGLMQIVETFEIDVAAIHHIVGSGLGHQEVEHVEVVDLSIGDMDKARDIPSQIEQRVQFDRRFGGPKWSPREKRQAQIDRGGIERINGCVEFQCRRLAGIELSRLPNQDLGEIGIDAPVAILGGIGESLAPDRLAKSHVIQVVGLGRKTDFDVPQIPAIGELSERHHAKLFGTRERSRAVVATISSHDSSKAGPRKEVHQLRKQRFADQHGTLREIAPGHPGRSDQSRSNRHQAKIVVTHCKNRRFKGHVLCSTGQ